MNDQAPSGEERKDEIGSGLMPQGVISARFGNSVEAALLQDQSVEETNKNQTQNPMHNAEATQEIGIQRAGLSQINETMRVDHANQISKDPVLIKAGIM